MGLLRRRTALGRLVKPVAELGVPALLVSKVADMHPPKAVKTGLTAAGGLAGLTAGSAAVSALRRRSEGSRDHS